MSEQNKTELYQSFASLIYAVAMADGILMNEEKDAIRKVIGNHPMMAPLNSLFESKEKLEISIVSAYYEVMTYIKQNKPDPEFSFLVQVLESLSSLSEGVEEEEGNLVEEFIIDLKSKLS